jgi:integrase
MSSFSINITRLDRKRKLNSGAVVMHTRYVLNYIEPKSGKRRQEFFERQKEALARRNELLARVETGTYYDERKAPTVKEAYRQSSQIASALDPDLGRGGLRRPRPVAADWP